MEYPFWAENVYSIASPKFASLNPSSNGIPVLGDEKAKWVKRYDISLNPSSNGIPVLGLNVRTFRVNLGTS